MTVLMAVHLIAPVAARSQGAGAVAGVIRDELGGLVVGAEIVAAGGEAVRSNDIGRYRISLREGPTTLTIRRLGFSAVAIPAVAGPWTEPTVVDVVLTAVPTVLPRVVVSATRPRYTGRLAGYYDRLERRSGGVFVPRERIDEQNSRSLSQLLATVPGVNAVRMRGGGGGVRLRGRTCWPLVWLDGTPMGAGEADLDMFPLHTIHGIEIYLGATTAPLRYTAPRNMSACGTILLWSRGPDTDPVTRQNRPRVDLERMLATMAVYTAEDVDRPAALDSTGKFDVQYPPALFAAGEGGSVLSEFVVDGSGRVESETIGIVSSTNPQLSEAVRRAVARATFRPALRGGYPVRQIVQQPFSFPPRIGRERRS